MLLPTGDLPDRSAKPSHLVTLMSRRRLPLLDLARCCHGGSEGRHVARIDKFCGGIVALAGAAGIALAVYLKLHPGSTTARSRRFHAAIYGVSVLIAGIALYCLGAVIDHLKASGTFSGDRSKYSKGWQEAALSNQRAASIATDGGPSASRPDAGSASSRN
jgi:hypothetical protein